MALTQDVGIPSACDDVVSASHQSLRVGAGAPDRKVLLRRHPPHEPRGRGGGRDGWIVLATSCVSI